MSIKARVAAVVAGLVLAGLSAAQFPRLEIPYRTRAIQVDGDLKEWAGQGLVAAFQDPDPRGNRVTARLAWDRQALYAAFDVVDPAVFPPPPNTQGSHLYQWDSVELYVGSGRNGPVMGSQDLQLIISSSGQVGALRGDELLASAGWQVPKREVASVGVSTAARPTSSGYAVECAIPWTVLGIDSPGAGRVLRIDFANNNWLENHPPLPEVVVDFDNVLELMDRGPEKRGEIRLDDPHEMGWAAGRAIVERAYLPWSWGGGQEFGRPETWHAAVLAGGPGWRERLAGALGIPGAALAASLFMGGMAGCALVLLSRRDRRRRGALLGRLREIEEELAAGPKTTPSPSTHSRPPPKELSAPSPPLRAAAGVHYDPLTTTIDRVESLVRRGDPVPRELCSQAIAYIVQHLHRPLAPQEVAAGVHVSLRTLQRGVSTSLGCTPGELITAVRMREAQRLLTREGLLVKDVALRLGFASVSHFSRSFKHFFQVPPSEVGSGQQPTFGPHN